MQMHCQKNLPVCKCEDHHENPNLIKADGYYLYNFGSPRHYYWALPVKFTLLETL